MARADLLKAKLPLEVKNKWTLAGVVSGFILILLLPWVSFTTGNGVVTAINPNERVQSLNAPVSGFIQVWHVNEGDSVKEGQPLADMIDSDPDIIDRMSREKDAARAGLEAANLMEQTSRINLERQKTLLGQGLSARKDYEKAKIEVSKLSMEVSKAQATLTKAETQLSRQNTQKIVAPRDGTVIRIIPGERGLLVKAGTPIAVFSPETETPAVEIWVDGNDASMVQVGQKARLQFEGWPALQIAGWPSIAVNTFKARVHLVDQASSHLGKFRVLLIPEGPWPSNRILRLGNHARGYIALSNSFVLREIWRIANGFPAFAEPIQDELNKMLSKDKTTDSEHYGSDKKKEETK
jgi:RND family efflux transporter MFP subunit